MILSYIQKYRDSNFQYEPEVTRNLAFIRAHTVEGEPVCILSGNQGGYYAESSTVSAVNIQNLRDIYTRHDLGILITYLKNNMVDKVFLDKEITKIYEYESLIPSLKQVLSEEYKITDVSPDKSVLLFKKNNHPVFTGSVSQPMEINPAGKIIPSIKNP